MELSDMNVLFVEDAAAGDGPRSLVAETPSIRVCRRSPVPHERGRRLHWIVPGMAAVLALAIAVLTALR